MSDALSILKDAKKHVMTGVSYMIPFAVLGGVMLAACVLLGGQNAVPTEGVLGQVATIGSAGLSLMVPVLSGFIAYSIADRGGIAPGFVSGYLATQIGAGFIGGLLTGLVTGIVVTYLKKIKLPSSVSSLMSIFIMPLAGGLIVCCLLLFCVGQPIAALMTWLADWLNGMSEGSSVILAVVLGAMICTDMGGAINKVAYSFGVSMVGTVDAATGMPSTASMQMMAAIGVAIGVPAIACGIATLLFRDRFSQEDRDAGLASIVMGCVGISEGAIPFAAKSPLRTIPPLMVGGAVGAALCAILGAGNPAPWGGIIVAPVCTNALGYLLATLVGSVVGGVGMGLLQPKAVEATEAEVAEDVDDFELDIELG